MHVCCESSVKHAQRGTEWWFEKRRLKVEVLSQWLPRRVLYMQVRGRELVRVISRKDLADSKARLEMKKSRIR